MVPQGQTSLRRSRPQFLKNPFPLTSLPHKACPSLTSVPKGRLFSALVPQSTSSLHCLVCKGSWRQSHLPGREHSKEGYKQWHTHMCRGGKDQSRRLSPDFFFSLKMQCLLGLRELASSNRGDSWPRCWSGTQKCGMQTAHLDGENPWGGDYR